MQWPRPVPTPKRPTFRFIWIVDLVYEAPPMRVADAQEITAILLLNEQLSLCGFFEFHGLEEFKNDTYECDYGWGSVYEGRRTNGPLKVIGHSQCTLHYTSRQRAHQTRHNPHVVSNCWSEV